MLAGRVVTLLLVQLPQHMAAGAVGQVQALLRLVPEGAEVASGQKELRPVLRERTARVAAEMALPSQAAARLAVLVVALEQTLLQLHRLPYTRATEALEVEAEAALMRRTMQQVQQELAALAIWKRQVLQQVMAV